MTHERLLSFVSAVGLGCRRGGLALVPLRLCPPNFRRLNSGDIKTFSGYLALPSGGALFSLRHHRVGCGAARRITPCALARAAEDCRLVRRGCDKCPIRKRSKPNLLK